MPSSGYTAITFVADELLTSTKMNLMAANDAAFNNGNGFEDDIIVNRHMANDSVTGDNLSLDHVSNVLSTNFGTSSTSYVDSGIKVTLPAAGTWLIFAECRGLSGSSGQFGVVQLYNQTTATALPDTERLNAYATAANERMNTTIVARLVTSTTNNIVRVNFKSGGAYTNTLESDPNGRSQMQALRIG